MQEAQKDHYDFVLKMHDRGVEVLDLQDLLAETLADPRPAPGCSTGASPQRRRPGSRSRDPALARRDPRRQLAEHLIGGVACDDLPQERVHGDAADAFGGTDFIVRPVPNTLFQRDPSCWIYGGVTCNPMYWPARQPETLLQRAVYKFHPRFTDDEFTIWWGDTDEDWATPRSRAAT